MKTTDQAWIDWADKFLGTPEQHTGAMSVYTRDALASMMASELRGSVQENERVLEATRGAISCNIVHAHVKRLGGSITPQALGVLATIIDRPGMAVMWGHAVVRMNQKNGRIVNAHDLALLMPHGVLTQEHLEAMWDAQKDKGANMLDTVENAPVEDAPTALAS